MVENLDGSLAFSDIIWQISRSLDLAPSTMALFKSWLLATCPCSLACSMRRGVGFSVLLDESLDTLYCTPLFTLR